MARFSKNAKIVHKISKSCDIRPSYLRNDYRSPEIHLQVDWSGTSAGCLISIFTVRINSKFFPWAVRCVQEASPKLLRYFPNYVLYR